MRTSSGVWISRMAVVVAALTGLSSLTANGAGTIYVTESGTPVPPYSDWATAATNIQTAIDYASTNLALYDTVLVTNGSYAVTNTISVTNGVKVIGLGGAAETVVYRTGTPNFRVFSLTHANAVLDGFTITNGLANGGGVYMTAGTVRNCTIRGNRSYGDPGYGGGIYMTGGLVTNCLVSENSYGGGGNNGYGGGIWMNAGTVANSVVSNNTANSGSGRSHAGGINLRGGTVVDCLIVSNSVNTASTDETFGEGSKGGGGVVVWNGGMLERSTVSGNQSNHRGGGVSFANGGSMMNCLVYSNTATSATAAQSGGGVWMSGGSLLNCTVVRNRSSQAGLTGGLVMSGGGVTNTIVYFNVDANDGAENVLKAGGTMSHSCTTPMVAGTGNVIDDPLFVDLDGLDLRLQTQSVCIDGGINLAAVTTDRAGNPRPVDFYGGGAVHDIGAYERQESPSVGDFRCSFTGTPRQGLVGYETVFTASVAGANTNGLTYYWHFTNGPSAELWGPDKQVVTNIYPAGVHSVRLVVSNSTPDGASVLRSAYIEALADRDAFVATDGSNTYPYDSWETAARDVNAALARIKTTLGMGGSSNTVWIGNGSHAVNATVPLNTNIVVRGASGSAADSVVYRVSGAPNLSVFSLSHSNAVVDGLTISNGVAFNGGGVNMTAGTLRNCTLRQNAVSGDVANGAGIWMSGGLVTNCLVTGGYRVSGNNAHGGGISMTGGLVVDSVISNNTLAATSGRAQAGGIYLAGGTVENCVIVSNTVSSSQYDDWGVYSHGGGGVLVLNGGVLDRCVVAGNRSDHRAGGVSVLGGLMKSCLVYGNTTTSATLGNGGGGLRMTGGSVVNCTVATNTASATEGGGISMSAGGVTNTIVYFNSGTVSDTRNVYQTGGSLVFSCTTPALVGEGNITDDPLFVNAAGLDFCIKGNSPCIDQGTNLTWLAGTKDLAGNNRVLGSSVDMGAYEIPPPVGTLILLR